MICRAKHDGEMCYRCGLPVRVGQMMDWRGWSGRARHAACQTEQERAVAPFDPRVGRYVSPHELAAPTAPDPSDADYTAKADAICARFTPYVSPVSTVEQVIEDAERRR